MRSQLFLHPPQGRGAGRKTKGSAPSGIIIAGDEEENSTPQWQFKETLCYYASAVAVLQGSGCVLIVCRGSW